MPESLITKKALASAMKELLTTKPFSKICIHDITGICHMNRKSFYYHFKDKYDLVNWIYYTDFVANVEQDLNTNTWDVLEKLCFYFYENRSFYYTILKIETHNPFNDYFIKAIEPLIMTSFADTFSNNDHKDFFNTYFVEALRSTIKYWVLYDSKIPPKDFINLLKSMMTEIAYKIVGI